MIEELRESWQQQVTVLLTEQRAQGEHVSVLGPTEVCKRGPQRLLHPLLEADELLVETQRFRCSQGETRTSGNAISDRSETLRGAMSGTRRSPVGSGTPRPHHFEPAAVVRLRPPQGHRPPSHRLHASAGDKHAHVDVQDYAADCGNGGQIVDDEASLSQFSPER